MYCDVVNVQPCFNFSAEIIILNFVPLFLWDAVNSKVHEYVSPSPAATGGIA